MADGFTISPHSSEFGPSPRWVRVYFNQQLIAESKDMMLLREPNCLPLYYFPKKDVRMDCLQASDRTAHSDRKGEGIFWHVAIGDRIAKDAAFTFQNPPGTVCRRGEGMEVFGGPLLTGGQQRSANDLFHD